jgi:HEAT repeat protein
MMSRFEQVSSTDARLQVSRLVLVLLLSAGCARTPAIQAQTRQVPVDSLIYDLKNPDPVRRRDAAKLLGDNKVKRATPDLVAIAGDPDPSVRRAVIGALANISDIRALPAFVNQSGDSEKDIREKCIESLVDLYLPRESGFLVSVGKVADFFNPWSDEWGEVVIEPGIKVDPGAISALRDRLADPEESIKIKSCRALGILKAQDALPSIIKSLQGDSSDTMRFEAVRSLRKIGDPSAASELMNFINYSDNKVRSEAVFTIGRLRYRAAVPELTRLLDQESAKPAKLIDKDYQERLLDAIAYIADPASKELFVKEKMNPSDLLRMHAIEGLARLGDASMASEISRDWLSERNPKIQTAQTFALYRMGRKEYMDDLVNRLGSGKTSFEAKQYLTELKPEELPDLYPQIRNNETTVREGLAEVLGLVGDRRAIPILQDLSKDNRGQIAAIANQALRRVNARTAGR